jgi:hypothetical protein
MLNQASGNPGASRAKAASARAFGWAAGFSLLVHLVLTPLAGWLGVFAWLLTPSTAVDTSIPEQLSSIPITWLGEEAAAEPVPPAPALTAPVALTEASGSTRLPAPTPDPPPQVPAPIAPAPTVPAPEEKPKTAEPKPRPRPDEIADPVALSGVQTELLPSNANVNLLLLCDRVREHPLGARIGKLLVNFPQWSSFFAAAELDPVRDLNRILVVGPEFRRSADMVAIIQHRLSRAVVREAVDRLVQRPPRGRWLKAKVPAARASADRAERLFVMPSPNLLVVAPPHLEKQLLSASALRFPTPEGKEALVLHVRAPAHALRGLPVSLPDSFAWLRLDVTPQEDGGAQLRITAEDASARDATSHARSLSTALNALTNPDLGALGALLGLRSIAFVDPIELRARGAQISGQVNVSRHQLERLLGLAEELLADWSERGPPKPVLPAAPVSSDAPKPVLPAAPASPDAAPGVLPASSSKHP